MERVRHHVSIADTISAGAIDSGFPDLNTELIYLHFRKAIAEPSQTNISFDDKEWSEDLQYEEQDPMYAIAIFKALRHATAKLLKMVPEDAWNFNTIIHPEMGAMNLDDLLTHYVSHTAKIISQIKSIRKLEVK